MSAAGCGGDETRVVASDAGPDASDDAGQDAGLDAGSDADTDSDTDAGPPDDGCPDLYDQELLPTFEVEIDEVEWAAMLAEQAAGCGFPKPYHPLRSFRYDGEEVLDASIRRKGNTCFSGRASKIQFVISFNEPPFEDRRFHGLRKIELDAPWYDPTMLHERLALSFLRDLGIPAQCANDARLDVNGEYYGVYTNLERLDRELLERVFGDADADGNLYKGGWELRTNEETADPARIEAFWATTDVATLETMGEVDEWVLEWAAEAILPDSDGYWCCENNYHLYDHPTRGFLFVPSDLDYTWDNGNLFPYEWDPLRPPTYGIVREHFDAVVADPEWHAAYVDAVREARAAYDVAELLGRIERWSAQVADAVEEDPSKPFTMEDHLATLDRLNDLVEARAAWIDGWLACAEDRDGDGVGFCEDCDEGVETCNWIDDDCDGVVDLVDDCCTDSWIGADHYALCRTPRTRADAESECEARGGTLAVPDTSLDQFALSVFVWWLAAEEYWIGANDLDRDGTFTAADGSALEYEPWGAREGDGDCAVMDPSIGFAWNDRNCAELHAGFCKLE